MAKPLTGLSRWAMACLFFMLLASLFGVVFFAYRICTRMSLETWATYAGNLQAKVWADEGRYRLLELSPEDKMRFTGKMDGPFEIWTWRHYTNTTWLMEPSADRAFIEAHNARIKGLWRAKQKASTPKTGPNDSPELAAAKDLEVMIKSPFRWVPITEVRLIADDHVRKRAPNLDFTNSNVSVWIDPSDTNSFMHFSYNQGLGKTAYLVYLGPDFKLFKFFEGKAEY